MLFRLILEKVAITEYRWVMPKEFGNWPISHRSIWAVSATVHTQSLSKMTSCGHFIKSALSGNYQVIIRTKICLLLMAILEWMIKSYQWQRRLWFIMAFQSQYLNLLLVCARYINVNLGWHYTFLKVSHICIKLFTLYLVSFSLNHFWNFLFYYVAPLAVFILPVEQRVQEEEADSLSALRSGVVPHLWSRVFADHSVGLA